MTIHFKFGGRRPPVRCRKERNKTSVLGERGTPLRRTHARRDGIEAPRGYEPEKDKLDEGDEEGTEAQG
jgi:hypothetical protein